MSQQSAGYNKTEQEWPEESCVSRDASVSEHWQYRSHVWRAESARVSRCCVRWCSIFRSGYIIVAASTLDVQ
jgi:hypothetical protein